MNAKLEVLKARLNDVEDRVSRLEVMIDEANPTDKGYTDLVTAFNKWSDIYMKLEEDVERLELQDELEDRVKEKRIDLALKCAEIVCKTAIPLIAIGASIGVAKLSYTQDAQLKLRNGNVMASARDLMQMARLKV